MAPVTQLTATNEASHSPSHTPLVKDDISLSIRHPIPLLQPRRLKVHGALVVVFPPATPTRVLDQTDVVAAAAAGADMAENAISVVGEGGCCGRVEGGGMSFIGRRLVVMVVTVRGHPVCRGWKGARDYVVVHAESVEGKVDRGVDLARRFRFAGGEPLEMYHQKLRQPGEDDLFRRLPFALAVGAFPDFIP